MQSRYFTSKKTGQSAFGEAVWGVVDAETGELVVDGLSKLMADSVADDMTRDSWHLCPIYECEFA